PVIRKSVEVSDQHGPIGLADKKLMHSWRCFYSYDRASTTGNCSFRTPSRPTLRWLIPVTTKPTSRPIRQKHSLVRSPVNKRCDISLGGVDIGFKYVSTRITSLVESRGRDMDKLPCRRVPEKITT